MSVFFILGFLFKLFSVLVVLCFIIDVFFVLFNVLVSVGIEVGCDSCLKIKVILCLKSVELFVKFLVNVKIVGIVVGRLGGDVKLWRVNMVWYWRKRGLVVFMSVLCSFLIFCVFLFWGMGGVGLIEVKLLFVVI